MNPIFNTAIKSLRTKLDRIRENPEQFQTTKDEVTSYVQKYNSLVQAAKANDINTANNIYNEINSGLDSLLGVSDPVVSEPVQTTPPTTSKPSSVTVRDKKSPQTPPTKKQTKPVSTTQPSISTQNVPLSDKINELKRLHPQIDKIQPTIDEYEAEKTKPEESQNTDILKKLETRLNFLFSSIKNKYAIMQDPRITDKLGGKNKEGTLPHQIKALHRQLASLDNIDKEVADKIREELQKHINDIDKILRGTDWKTFDELYSQLKHPSNVIHKMTSTIERFKKTGVYSKYSDEGGQQTKANNDNNIASWVSAELRKREAEINRSNRKNRMYDKFRTPNDTQPNDTQPNDTQQVNTQPDGELPLDLSGDLEDPSSLQSMMDYVIKNKDKDGLDPEMVDYAVNLAKNAKSEFEIEDAKLALDYAMQRKSLDNYKSFMSINESRKKVKKKILKAFEH